MPMAGRIVFGLALLASLLAVGCSTQTSYRSKSLLKLQVGMTREEVFSIMGKPQRQEIHGDTEVLFYTTGDVGNATEDTTPLMFVGGRLAGLGHLAYESFLRSHKAVGDGRRVD
jgi:Protein of unknown function (DUF3192)